MTVDTILEKFWETKTDPFPDYTVVNMLPAGTQKLKKQIIERLHVKIRQQDPKDLDFLLVMANRDGLDDDYKPILKALILAPWHDCHEDLVDYLRDIRDDMFTDDLYSIAITPDPYRKYDDELEATLRKCVHALKSINSPKAIERLEQLKATGNPNIMYALEMYK